MRYFRKISRRGAMKNAVNWLKVGGTQFGPALGDGMMSKFDYVPKGRRHGPMIRGKIRRAGFVCTQNPGGKGR